MSRKIYLIIRYMRRYIEPFYFFIALVIGLFFTYISTPLPKLVIKYPTPENVDNIVYKDNADICYKYVVEDIDCPKDKTKIKEIELQHAEEEEDRGLFSKLSKMFS